MIATDTAEIHRLQDRFPFKRMALHLQANCRAGMNRWELEFTQSMDDKLRRHPDLSHVTESEVVEYFSRKEKIKIIEVWERMGL